MSEFFVTMPDEEVEWIQPADLPSRSTAESILAAKAGDGARWDPPRVRIVSADEHGRRWRRTTLPWLGSHVLVLRDEAISKISPILASHGEIRPLACEDAVQLALFIPPWVSGAVDWDRSDIVRFGDGRIMQVRSPVFRPGASEHGAFRLAEVSRGNLYFRGDVVRALRDTGAADGTLFVPA